MWGSGECVDWSLTAWLGECVDWSLTVWLGECVDWSLTAWLGELEQGADNLSWPWFLH